jgi:hypothetical protein
MVGMPAEIPGNPAFGDRLASQLTGKLLYHCSCRWQTSFGKRFDVSYKLGFVFWVEGLVAYAIVVVLVFVSSHQRRSFYAILFSNLLVRELFSWIARFDFSNRFLNRIHGR